MTDNEGFIVFDCGGSSPIDYGGSEKWFANYDDAESYARRRIAQGNSDEVVIYRGAKELLMKSHASPGSDVLFWYDRVKSKDW